MLNLNLNLKLNELSCDTAVALEGKAAASGGVAVIGINAKVGSALTKEAIWQAFVQGLDMITELPEERVADAQRFSEVINGRQVKRFSQRAYLPSIDKFDPTLFKISPTEAELMDPVHRLYLESAWAALEDAGYGGELLSGSKTGVYVGYNNVGQGYEALLKDVPQETLGVMLSGNVSSFLASRLSYLLNLTGPAMVIDTACSSSLVAVHEACKALKSGEITAAVVGSIRIFYCPEHSGEDIGTSSSSERTKTFDESADGTGGGEGVINLVLKPLESALRDRDHIYGVIKGSCANQDGSSIGITAPNSAAQESAILEAWKEAGIDPENIGYIEAHGTATKLGDPVEIGGLTAAFSHFTQKKQFCAIGASKSNFGHLDCASGLLGLVKVLLMMQHRTIPPTVHFAAPNRKIDYINSPVYINDCVKPWITNDGIMTAGVSSFGLSGTNCHVVVQSFEEKLPQKSVGKQLLTASAMDRSTLQKLLLSYQDYLTAKPNLADFCYTTNTGRGQYRCRFAMVLDDVERFLALDVENLPDMPYYNEFRIVNDTAKAEKGLLTLSMQEKLSTKAKQTTNLEELASLYLQGAQIDFAPLYDGENVQKLSVPTYPFNRRRCWYTPSVKEKEPELLIMHPLVDRCILRSHGLHVYEKRITLDTCMEIREHRINGVCVMPGTVYVEIAHAIGCDIFGDKNFVFSNVTFFSLMTCAPHEERILHAIVQERNGELNITMASRGEGEDWIDHIEAVLKRETSNNRRETVDLQGLLQSYPQVYTQNSDEDASQFVQLGEHWQTGKALYVDENSVVLFSDVSEQFRNEAQRYALYPPLLDGSMNSGIILLDGQYLPLNYKNARFYSKLCNQTYSRITRKQESTATDEIALFEVKMFDNEGNLIGEIEEYSLKRVNQAEKFLKNRDSLYQIKWFASDLDANVLPNTSAYVFLTKVQEQLPIVSAIKKQCKKTILLYLSNETKQLSETAYCVRNSDADIKQVLENFAPLKNPVFINILPFAEDPEDVETGIRTKIQTNFYITKALSCFAEQKTYAVLALQANNITAREKCYHPMNQAVIGFVSCLESEQSNLKVRVIDADVQTDAECLAMHLLTDNDKIVTGFRENCRYVEQLCPAVKDAEPITLADGDVIVIAGGYGGMGLALSEHIFSKYPHTKLVLLSRHGVKGDADDRKATLDRLVCAGCEIKVLQADVSDAAQTANALEIVRRTYGKINGIILAAGIAGDGMLSRKAWEKALKVLRPKILGAWNLHVASLPDKLKYFVLCSSFTSILGAPGQTDYAAANAYLDAFTHERNRLGYKTLTINWTGWKESGMAKQHQVDWENSIVSFVTNEEGKQLFADALELGSERLIACSFRDDLPMREIEEIQRRLTLPKGVIKIEPEVTILEKDAEMPIIYGKSFDKLTIVEQNIALAWARTLHVSEVNIYDKFFEAGGNSLLASYLQKEINRIYPDAMAITDVFVYSTISDIAAYISAKKGIDVPQENNSADTAELEDLVQQFMSGKLSLEEMENLV